LHKGVDALAGITDARVAVFVDLDEDGTLDVMVQRTGEQGAGRILFVQNNFYYDAFFMKAIRTCHSSVSLSVACDSFDFRSSDRYSSEWSVWLGLVPT
jgi:hypothetical protein